MDTSYAQPSSGGLGLVFIFLLIFAVIYIVAFWRIFTKAGKPGWASIVPFYNIYILLQIIGRPGWWLLLYFIPGVNFVISIINALDLAKSFGKSSLFGVVGLWLFGFIGYLILGFGKDQYLGPQGMGDGSLTTTPPGVGEITPMNKPPVSTAPQPVAEKPLIQDVTSPSSISSEAPAPQPAIAPITPPSDQPSETSSVNPKP